MASRTTDISPVVDTTTNPILATEAELISKNIKQSFSDDIITPLPWRQVLILLGVRISEPISFTILFPFIVYMVKDFHVTENEHEIGFYVGLIASTFAFAQFLCGIPWGILSDRIGRRPVMIMGLLGSAISLTLFGLSKSLAWALVTRTMCGLLNGNVGVVKSMMAELTDSTNRAIGFSYLPMCFGLGSIIGPLLGGYLSDPVKFYPWLFNEGPIKEFFVYYPYFLPCFVSSLFCFLDAIFGYFYLEETLGGRSLSRSSSQTTIISTETEPILGSKNSEETLRNYSSISQTTVSKPSTSSAKPQFAISDSSLESQIKPEDNSIPSASWITILGYSGLSLQSVIQDELFPLWATTSLLSGGLGFDQRDIGSYMAFGGIALIVIQLTSYAPIQRRFGTLTLYKKVYLFYTPAVLLFTMTGLVVTLNSTSLLWTYLLLVNFIRTGCGVFAFTSVNILLAETCPNQKILGKVNGIAQCLGSLMRGIGPTMCGLIYGWSTSNTGVIPFVTPVFTWVVVAFISLINLYIANLIN